MIGFGGAVVQPSRHYPTSSPAQTAVERQHEPQDGRHHGTFQIVFFYRSREAVKLGCRKILLDKISSFGYSMVDESIRRPTGT